MNQRTAQPWHSDVPTLRTVRPRTTPGRTLHDHIDHHDPHLAGGTRAGAVR